MCNLGGYTYVGTKNGCVPLRLSNQAGWVVGLGKGLTVSLTGVHADYRGNRHANGGCGYSPLSVRGVTKCMCAGYPATNTFGDCTICGAGYYETMADYQADIPPAENGGFVESEGIKVKEMKEVFPVTITAYRGEKAFKVYGVIESSIASKPDREGNITLSFETLQSRDEIGYIPCVDWYTTELES